MPKKTKKLNGGEREELLIKIILCSFRDYKKKIPSIGKIEKVGFENEYGSINWNNIDFNKLKKNDSKIRNIAKQLNISKGSSLDKADVKINDTFYSLKCTGYGKPTIVNHTSRVGFLNIADIKSLNISDLDSIVDKYWTLRENNEISEDCPNSHEKSPFKNKKHIIKPFLDFFIFEGSGKGKSKYPAEKVLEFEKFNETISWKIFSSEYLDQHWEKLYFCLRYKKGIMPINQTAYDNHKYKDKISPWIRYFKGKKGEKKFRGALHVRVG